MSSSTYIHSTKLLFDELVIRQKLLTKCRSRQSVVRRSVAHQVIFNNMVSEPGSVIFNIMVSEPESVIFNNMVSEPGSVIFSSPGQSPGRAIVLPRLWRWHSR